MEKIDRRIKRTQRLLQEALISLTLEKGFNVVTIRDITERADVGYATFFRHYADKDALLADVLDSMSQEFRMMLTPQAILTDPEEMGTLLFKYVEENASLVRVLLDSTNTMTLLRPILEIGRQEFAEMFNGTIDRSIPMDIAASHLMISLVMMIRLWLEREMPYSPERMGHIVANLIIRPVVEALQVPD